MRWGYVWKVVGVVLLCTGLAMLLPLLFAAFYGDDSAVPLALSSAVTVVVGLCLHLGLRSQKGQSINHREGMVITALSWTAVGAFGALPFFLSGFENFTDAMFESVSGLTTTGASVMTDIEAMPKGLLVWRAMTQWLGGMGIIVLSLAILPFLGVGGMQLYKAEVPGPVPDKLQPKIKDTAMTLWKVYVLFTLIQTLLLLFGGLDLCDSLSHAFATMATGGFSTRNASVASFGSAYVEWVVTFFMFLAGVNFALHFQALRGRPLAVWRDPEFRFFAVILLVCVLIGTVDLYAAEYHDTFDALRYSAFQVVSIMTTTGFATADYEAWPFVVQGILVALMFFGGCAGSTSGGPKCMRIMLLAKQAYNELFRLVHPRSVTTIKLGDRIVKPDVMSGVWGFFVLFLALFVLTGILLAATGLDLGTAFSASIACIGNIGPGFGSVGPAENYAHIPAFGKWVLICGMIIGRLEIYTVIVLFVPEFWRK
ncbi:MAG: TrkH family potassium uptake protein [Deltaproteobacteria bacterium]|nr:TrkH family potassium uptake protein [Deltaproteobacteria bacterium]